MNQKRKSYEDLAAELKVLKRQKMGGGFASVINNMVLWGGICTIAYFTYKSIDSLAGQRTDANIGVVLLGSLKLSEVFAFLFGGGGVVYGWKERSLRKSTIERLQNRIKKLETSVDPNRTSSGLTPKGDTNPNDI